VPEENLSQLAPNLSLAYRRLQRDWILNRWLPKPSDLVPGTRMPSFDQETIANTAASIHLTGEPREMTEALVDYVLSLGAPTTNVPTPTAKTESAKAAD